MLPSELLSHICSFLSTSCPDLAALARVSLSWSAVAQRVLYRHLNVPNHPGPLITLANNPVLAALVRSFAVPQHNHPLLSRALANMSHLVELDLFLDAPHILQNSTDYPLLQRFATSLPWSPLLVQFLHRCPTISQLYLDSPSPDVLSLPPSFLPALSHFTGPPSLALALVPHRPVQHIDLTLSPNLSPLSLALTPDLALSLSQSSAPILALAATTSSTGHGQPQPEDENLVRVLRVLAACMGHLRHLRVVTNTYADASTFGQIGVFTDSYFENITDALTSLPDLQSCEIWGFHWVSSKKKDMAYSSVSASTTTWHSPTFTTTNNTTTNFLDDLYQDLIFPY